MWYLLLVEEVVVVVQVQVVLVRSSLQVFVFLVKSMQMVKTKRKKDLCCYISIDYLTNLKIRCNKRFTLFTLALRTLFNYFICNSINLSAYADITYYWRMVWKFHQTQIYNLFDICIALGTLSFCHFLFCFSSFSFLCATLEQVKTQTCNSFFIDISYLILLLLFLGNKENHNTTTLHMLEKRTKTAKKDIKVLKIGRY